MIEQIEVFGQFDVRRNDVINENEIGLNNQKSIDTARITNTFGGDQLNAALDAVNNKKTYIRLFFTEIFPDAIGLFFVLSTITSIFLSKISLTIHPADLINTAPKKNNKQCFKKT